MQRSVDGGREGVFGAVLRGHRLAAGLTQEELTDRAGLGVRTVQALEAGESRPRGETVQRLAQALALSDEQRARLAAASAVGARPQGARAAVGIGRPGATAPRGASPTPLLGREEEELPEVAAPLRRPTICQSCGHENRASGSACESCGARLARTCPQCGVEVPPDAHFCGACGGRLVAGGMSASPTPAPGAPGAPGAPVAPGAPPEERRWATVLFAEVSGSTLLAQRTDPEDVEAFAAVCIERLGELVRRFGGRIIAVAGDTVLAVFGAPAAHEDDAERAVRAALAMCAGTFAEDLAQPIELQVGINTGLVLAGEIGPPEQRQVVLLGDTTRSAARLRSAAPPGSVLVAEATYQATSRVVRYRPLGAVETQGSAFPIPAWEALDMVTPLPQPRPLGTAPLIGRDQDLALLAGIWAKVVREAQPYLVTVLGEAGIGKSRLVVEFERHALGDALVLHGRCPPFGEALGYGALAGALKEAAGITPEDGPVAARAQLDRLAAGALSDGPEGDGHQRPAWGDTARYLALLSGVDVAADRAPAPPDQRTLHAAVRRFLEALARHRPLCLLLEDVHWADEALLDLIEFVAAYARDAPLLIVTQARPELLEQRPAWGRGVRASTSLALAPLGEAASRALLLALCRERGLPEHVVEQVSHSAGGNPLFAEELVAAVAERGGAGGTPAAITALIAARLDALAPEKRQALRLAAVFGRTFWPGGLRAAGAGAGVLDHLEALALDDLLREQHRSQFGDEREFAFKHDLIRDVAYGLLPRAERRRLHGRAADWIEQRAGERVEEHLDALAHHSVQADRPARALDYLARAAQRAGRAAAHREEAALLAQAIAIAERLEQGEVAAELRARLGNALWSIGQWKEAKTAFEAALAGLPPQRRERRAEVHVDLSWAAAYALDTPTARHHATAALALAEETGRPDLTAHANGSLGLSESAGGDLVKSMKQLGAASERARALGLDLPPRASSWHTLMLYWTGRPTEAAERGREAVQVARRLNNVAETILALMVAGLSLASSGRYAEAMRSFAEADRFGRERGAESLVARNAAFSVGFHLDIFDYDGLEALAATAREFGRSSNHGPAVFNPAIDLLFAFARTHRVGKAEALVPEVQEGIAQTGNWHHWLWQIRLAAARAELALARGDWDAALRLAGEATERARAKGRVKYEAIGLAAHGRALAARGRTKAALAPLRRAVELVRPVGDPAMFLRATTALLEVDGDDALAGQARAAATRILNALPDPELRGTFAAAEPVRRLLRTAAP